MQIKKWKLLAKKDVSPSKWFPIELRKYELPNGKIIDDFTITTLTDVAMIVPVTPDENEEIEVITYTFEEVENLIQENKINAAITVAAWDLAKRKYSNRFRSWG